MRVVPQINPPKWSTHREVIENALDEQFRVPAGPPNNLPVGGILPVSRVAPDPLIAKPLFPGITATGWVPADPTAAVGLNFIVETVNETLAFFKRDGTMTFEQSMAGGSGFFASVGAGGNVFDPKCFYDPNTKRFFIVALEQDSTSSTSFFDIAVSATDDPNGNWNKFRFSNKLVSGGQTYWLDYPGWGFNKDWVVASGNMFGFTSGLAGVQVFAFPKQSLINGSTTGTQIFLDSNAFTIQWAKNPDANLDTAYGVEADTTSSMKLYALKGTGSSVQLLSQSVTVPTWNSPGLAVSTGGNIISTVGPRMLTAAYRNGHLVASHSIDAGETDGRVACRWYDFNTNAWPDSSNAPTLNQSGNLEGGPSEDLWMPAININKSGSIGMIFSRCSPTIAADVLMTGRKPTDPPGTMGKITQFFSGAGSYPFFRWGDYFSVEVDPVNSRTFWGVAMSISGQDWNTQIGSWKVVDINDALPFTINSATMFQGSGSTGTVSDLLAVDGATFNVASTFVRNLGNVAAVKVTATSPFPTSQLDTPIFVKVTATAPPTTTLQVFALNINTGKYDVLQQAPFNGVTSVVIQANQVPNYVSASGGLTLVVRALNGLHPLAKPFTVNVDQIQVLGLPAF